MMRQRYVLACLVASSKSILAAQSSGLAGFFFMKHALAICFAIGERTYSADIGVVDSNPLLHLCLNLTEKDCSSGLEPGGEILTAIVTIMYADF